MQVHLSGSPRVGSVAITMSPGSYQHFTIFVVQLLEGNKAMYKPCAEFKGRFQVSRYMITGMVAFFYPSSISLLQVVIF